MTPKAPPIFDGDVTPNPVETIKSGVGSSDVMMSNHHDYAARIITQLKASTNDQ